jgi:pimeloyl-ACP methyl ester carboxylesterase
MMIKSLSEYDPDFTRAYVEGRACEGFSHAEALTRIKCPLLVLHANWFRHPEYGLVGSMDENDIERLRSLAPQAQYRRITSGHMIHYESPEEFRRVIVDFTQQLSK